MANNDKENKIKKFTKEAIGKTLNQFNKEIGMADLVEVNKNQDRILNGILSQVNDENTEKTEKSNIITLDNSTDGIVELKEIQGDTNVNVSKIEEDMPITHNIGDKEGNVFSLNEIPKGAISIGEIQGNTMVNCNKDDEKELVLMKDLSAQGDNNITITEGVDGGLVDVTLEGNTMVNVSDQKDPVAITKSYTVETGNHVALQGEYDGKCRPVVTGNTLVNLVNDTQQLNKTWKVEVKMNYAKPDTDYTLIFELSDIVNNDNFEYLYVSIENYANAQMNDVIFTNGFKMAKVTTRNSSSDIALDTNNDVYACFWIPNGGTSTYSLKNIIVLEGDYTNKPIPEYFEGLKSSFEDKVVPSPIANIGTCDLSQRANYNVEGNIQIKANTTYTLIYTSSIDTNELLGFQYKEGKKYTYWNNNKKGLNVRVFEADEDKIIWLFGRGTTIEGLIISDIYLFEGDYTSYDFSDYDPTKAGKYRVDYVVTGKNKFDGELESGTIVQGNYGDNTNSLRSKNFVKIKPNTVYTLSKVGTEYGIISFYNTEFEYIAQVQVLNREVLAFSHSKACYIKFYFDNLNTQIQIEEGSTATSYEPYKEYKKTFYLNSPLLEGDTIEQQGNNVVHVHRYKKVVLNGSDDEKYFRYTTYEGDIAFTCNYGDYPCKINGKHFKDTSMTFVMGANIDIRPVDSGLNITTVDELRSYFNNNVTTFVYELRTPQYEVISQNDTILCDSYVNGHLDVDSVVPIEKIKFNGCPNMYLKYVYSDTRYILQFEADNEGIIQAVHIGGKYLTDVRVNKGLNKLYLDTILDGNLFTVKGIGFNASNIVVTEATDQDFGYFEGMKSVGECEDLEVVSCNKNLVDMISLISSIESTIRVDGYWFVEVPNTKPNTDYIFKSICKEVPINRILVGFSTEKDYRKIISVGAGANAPEGYSEKKIITTNSDGKLYLAFYHYTNEYGNYNSLKEQYQHCITLQLEEGTTATDYIPHAHNTQTLTHEPLRAVGDIKDKYVLIDSKWYIERNTAEVVLDGSDDETWINFIINADEKQPNTAFAEIMYMNLATGKCVSNKMTLEKDLWGKEELDNYECVSAVNKRIQVLIPKNKLETQNLTGFRKYLTNNQLKVVYQLQTPTYEPIDYNPFEVYSDTTHISNNSTIPCNMTIKNTGYNCLLKPSTTYTVSSNLGLNTVTTPSTLTEDCLRFYDTDTSDVTTMKNVMVLEGDYTTGKPIPSHFSGIESAFEQEYDEEKGKYKVKVKVVGKNLFNVNELSDPISNKYYYGGIRNWREYQLKPNTTYNISAIVTNTNHNMSYSYLCNSSLSNPSYIVRGNQSIGTKGYKCVTTNNDGLLLIGDYFGIISDYADVIITESSYSNYVEYEPYKENYIEFYIDEPLRGIGDVKDKVYIKDDKVVVERNCGSVTLDGSDDETIINYTNGVKTHAFGIKNGIDNVQYMWSCLSNNFISYGSSLASANSRDREDIVIGGSVAPFTIYINKNKLNENTVNGFRQWLQQNPTTVVYQLAEPTYEEVEYSESRLLLNTYNNSTLFYESNIPVSNTSFKPLWEELAYLKNSTKYYIQFNSTASGTVVFNLGGTEVTKDIVEGYNCIPITTPSESTNLMTISGQGITISEVVVSEVVCGGYYKGLQSCFEEHMENGKYRVLLRGIALDGSKVNGIKLYINEPLRGIGDVKDRLCVKNGKLMVERKCGSVTLDGSDDEKWGIQPSLTTDLCSMYYIAIGNAHESKKLIYMNDKFTQFNSNYSEKLDKEGMYTAWNGLYVNIFNYKLSSITNNGFKQYLQQNPLTVVYQLAEPIYEEVTNEYGLPIIFEGYENGIVYIDSAVTPTTHIKYTSNNQLATTLSEAEEQNIATQEDINMNVVTYMMDIDMILTDMEMSNDTSVMAVRRDSSNENMLDRMSEEDKKVYRDNTVVMLEKMITAKVLEKEDIEGRINMYYNKNRISKEQYEYLKSLL